MFLVHIALFPTAKTSIFFYWPLLGDYSYRKEKHTFESHSGTHFVVEHKHAKFECYVIYENEASFL